MKISNYLKVITLIVIIILLADMHSIYSSSKSIFMNKADVGKINLPGKIEFTSTTNTYMLTGSGENIWGKEDAFYFAWNEMEGDISFSTEITWIGDGKNAHRKAGIMIRDGIEPDDAYVDVVVHGDGLTSMQYRKKKGGDTFEIKAPVNAPSKIKLEKTGDQYTFYYTTKDDIFHPGGTITLKLNNNLTGLIICSHDSTISESALFSDVTLLSNKLSSNSERVVESTLETINIETGIRTIVRRAKEHFEAPNWKFNDNSLIYNSDGKIYSINAKGGEPQLLKTSFATNCNNDHGLSPDQTEIVISHHSVDDHKSYIYILPIEGGVPRLVTDNAPSYWHGWSPDGSTLVYCAERDKEYDVYSVSVNGGLETRLTNAAGLDDGPEYSPDGKFIYFNSVRTGQMKIWRMNSDGSNETQITPNDEFGDWFAHPSPNNKWLVFVSYNKSVEGHPANKDVVLRIMPTEGGEPQIITTLFGGQGTMNVPSWSSNSKEFAFVSYRLVVPDSNTE